MVSYTHYIVKIDSRTQSFCLCQYVQNGLSYSGKETWPKLCLKGRQAYFGVSSLRTNTAQLLHRIQMWSISSTFYAQVFCLKVLLYFCQNQNITRWTKYIHLYYCDNRPIAISWMCYGKSPLYLLRKVQPINFCNISAMIEKKLYSFARDKENQSKCLFSFSQNKQNKQYWKYAENINNNADLRFSFWS